MAGQPDDDKRVGDAADGASNGVAELAAELRYIKQHSSYRLASRLRNSSLWNALRWLCNRNRRIVHVRATGRSNAASQGAEVWLLAVSPNQGERPVPWDFFECGNGWRAQAAPHRPYGQCLVTQSGGSLRVPVDRDPELRFLSHPWSGEVEITFHGRRQTVDLYSPGGEVRVLPGREPMCVIPVADEPSRDQLTPSRDRKGAVKATPHEHRYRTRADQQFLERTTSNQAPVVAVHCPRWVGVTNSTRTLFDHTYAVPESPAQEPYTLDDAALDRHAHVLCQSGARHVVFSGGDEAHLRLLRRIKASRPDVRCDMLWHGGYLFFEKDYDWRVLRQWLDAARAADVTTIGTVKKGMDAFLRSVGLRSKFVMNYVPGTPDDPPPIAAAGAHVGIWMSGTDWKVPHAMLSALRMIPGARLHAAGLSDRAREVAEYFGVPIEHFQRGPLPAEQLREAIRRTHLTLYVTFTECCPMLPLESIRLGVPSLIGPTSHLFEDDAYLFERLVVPFPERAEIIAGCIERAITDRDAIVAACQSYIPGYNDRAARSVAEFLA